MYLIYRAKRLKIVKSKSLNQTFSAVCHHQGIEKEKLVHFELETGPFCQAGERR